MHLVLLQLANSSRNGYLKWTLGAIGYQCGLAYMVSFVIYQLGHVLVEKGTLTLVFSDGRCFSWILFPYKKTKARQKKVSKQSLLERGK